MENEEIVEMDEETILEESDVTPQIEKDTPSKKSKKLKLKYRTTKNDIRYRGPLSYRSVRIIAWIFLIISQLSVLMKFAMKVSPDLVTSLNGPMQVFEFARTFPVPLFLLANFAFILQGKADFRKLLFFYGGVALVLYIAGIVLMSHFVMGFVYGVDPSTFDFANYNLVFGTAFVSIGNPSLYSLNIFIDLFLCALTYFFIHYHPKKYIQNKKLIFFRLMAFIPILYELGSIFIKYMTITGRMQIPYFVFFALTAKPPFMFVAFILIILVMKIQELSFIKRFKGEEALDDHLRTNAHSLKVSITIFWVFIASALLDLVALLAYAIGYTAIYSTTEEEALNNLYAAIAYGYNIGLGESASLLLVAPIALLFSYSKKPKHPEYDKFIPIVAILIIIVVYIEGTFRILTYRFTQFVDWLSNLLHGGGL